MTRKEMMIPMAAYAAGVATPDDWVSRVKELLPWLLSLIEMIIGWLA